jgi:hypothetical protein
MDPADVLPRRAQTIQQALRLVADVLEPLGPIGHLGLIDMDSFDHLSQV